MTSDRRLERDIPELLAQLAPRVEPTPYRDDVVRQTARMRQRPAWTFPERWIPVDVALAPGRGRPRPFAALALIVLVGLLIGALLVAYIGSRPVAVPPPFGPAANGALYFGDANGDIMTVASLSGIPKAIVTGVEHDRAPVASRDGRLIAFPRDVPGGTEIVVADTDGANVRSLMGLYSEFSEIDWAPTSDELAIVSDINGRRQVTILETDGTGAETLDFGTVDLHSLWYLPDGRLIFNGTTKQDLKTIYGLYVVDPHGSAPPRAIGLTTPFEEILAPNASPDGKSVVYHHWSDDDQGLHIRDIATGDDHRIPIVAGPLDAFQEAQFSPDGRSILVGHFTECCLTLSVVPVEGGTPKDIGVSLAENTMPWSAYAPDGKTILAWYPSLRQLWQLDPTGAAPGRQVDLPVRDMPAYQRKAKP